VDNTERYRGRKKTENAAQRNDAKTLFSVVRDIITGVCQGCILSPFLLLLMIDFVTRKAVSEPNMGIQWTDSTRLTDLDFADDLSLLAQSRVTLHKMTTNLEIEAKKVGLRISAEKTKVIQICTTTLQKFITLQTLQTQIITNARLQISVGLEHGMCRHYISNR